MKLSFKTELYKKPSYFPEKILRSIYELSMQDDQNNSVPEINIEGFYKSGYNFNCIQFYTCRQKLHTIREDKPDRWKSNMKIHFVIFNRSKNEFRFAPVLLCKSTQKFELYYDHKNNKRSVYIDDKLFYSENFNHIPDFFLKFLFMRQLAFNDGFNSIKDFFNYFDKPFKGKIIHWTDKIY